MQFHLQRVKKLKNIQVGKVGGSAEHLRHHMGLRVGTICKQHWHRLETSEFSMVFYIQGTD